MIPIELTHLIGSIPGQAGKDLRHNTVSAPRQAEPRQLTNASIVRLAQQGDAVAFKRIYRLPSRQVCGLCLRMVGDPTAARDLTRIRQNSSEVPDVQFEGSLGGPASYTWVR